MKTILQRLTILTLMITGWSWHAESQITTKFVGRYSIGTYNSNGGVAEISAYDPNSKRMFVINGPDSSIRIVNIANPAVPVLIATLSIKPYGIDITSIACNKNGLIAMAVIDSGGKTNPSNIVFIDINGAFISKVKAGPNADNIVFTNDGKKLLVANEGEPNVGYTIDPEGSVSIIDLTNGAASLTQSNVQTAGFTAFNSPTVLDPRIRIYGRIQTSGGTFLRNASVAEDLEPEYITISDDNSTAWVTCQENNCVAVVNINTATVTSLLPLGYKNHRLVGNGLDPSDRDNGTNGPLAKIDTFQVFGMYMPDGIGSYKVGSQTYFVTANEGDARADWGAANVEENRVGDAAYVLDSSKFGGAAGVAAIKSNLALGRLTVSNRTGDFNNDGKFDSIFAFGARSFSIWDATTGNLVWDSKDEFERKILALYPANFNTGHTTNALDDRSDNKGPEPESVTLGKIKDSTYAFIGLERIGGIMIYNITDPNNPYFVQYINTRDFAVTPNQSNLASVGDLGPEGIVFVPSYESPTGENMILLSNEVSGTVAMFTVNTPETQGITKLKDYQNNTSATIGTFQGINYKEAGFSTLFPIPNTNGKEFWTCSDRGVNIDCANANLAACRPTYDKMYPFPSYSPKIHRIRINGDSIQILQSITIKRPNGAGATGIINPTGLGSKATEVASTDTVLDCANFNLKTTPKDTFGIDPEGLVVDKAGNFWLCEEGGATIWKLNQNGILLKRYTPYANLAGVQSVDVQIDSVFKYRKNNRGFEGIAITPSGKIYAAIQSGISYPTSTVGDNSRVLRILEIDPVNDNQRMLAYLNDGIIGASGSNQIRMSDWKLGDMAAINDSTFLVLEAAARGTSDIKRLYQININQATAVHSGLYGGLTLEGLVDSTGLANKGIKPVTKTLVMDLLASGWPAALDKAEGLAIINDSTIAISNDNDFGQKSTAANGIATATGNLSHLITYRLSGIRKLTNFIPSTLSISTQSSYLQPIANGVTFNPILTAGDVINGYKMAGIPDGAGAWDNGNGTFTLLVNHEIPNTSGIARAHGAKGAFISKWVINKNNLSIVSGSDLIQKVSLWNGTSYTLYNPADTASKKAFNRFCSADLPAVTAFYNAATGLGTTERIFMNGEESGTEGRAFAHITSGANAGNTYELPALGKFSWENAIANPTAQDKTIVAGTDDSTPGQVYMYIGTKTNSGTEVEKAGLTNGKLYGISVAGLTNEVSANFPAANTAFTLVDLGVVRDSTGASLNSRSNTLGVTNFLRPEDGTWDPSNPADFYFVTTNGFGSPSRLWRAHFNDIKNPTTGGTITALLDGTEGQQMMDNITIDNFGHIIIQEDVGNNVHNGKIWQYTIATDKLNLLAQHDTTRFINGAANFLTQDEEASGVIDVQNILGAGNFLLVDQAHYAIAGEVYEGGQILKMFNPATANSSLGQGPSSSATPYLLPVASGVKTTSILTAGDSIGSYKMAGIPDGLGAYDNNDGTFTLLVSHEIPSAFGVTRAHGSAGAFVSKWVINKNNLSVVSGSDLMKIVKLWDTTSKAFVTYNAANPSSKAAFSRFCSADLPAASAFYNSLSAKGTTEKIYMNGEESGTEGRVVAHIVTGANAGTSYELPALGKASWENAVASPASKDTTVVALMDDGTDGQVYLYIGAKTATGTEIDKAGLTNGKPYGVKVTGFAKERVSSTVLNPLPSAGTRFSLVNVGDVTNMTGVNFNTASNTAGITSFSRPEDGAWDPANPNDFYFNTTDQFDQVLDGLGTQVGRSRVWRLRFDDITKPSIGGTIEAVLDGTEGQIMFDNMAIDNYGHIILQEDVGNSPHNGKVWQYDIATDKLTLLAKHDPARFGDIGQSATAPYNLDEESSGAIDMQSILGPGMFMMVDQAHYSVGGEIYEGGQILSFFNPATFNSNPEINLTGNNISILNGDTISQVSDFTQFETTTLGKTSQRTFYIRNSGPGALTIKSIAITGQNASEFSIPANPTFPINIAANNNMLFTVQYAPSSLGNSKANITINNNDFDENAYLFAIAGSGISPEINVKGNSVSIPNNDTTISAADNTNFGDVVSGKNTSKQFVIENTGNDTLRISGINFTGANSSEFTIVSPPTFPLSIAPSSNTSFTVRFAPTTTGFRNAKVNINSNDLDEAAYAFNIRGNGLPIPAPEINVQGNGINIVDGESFPGTADNTDFGSVQSGGSVTKGFVIQNTGTDTLKLTSISFSGDHATEFVVTPAITFPTTILAGASMNISVKFTPANLGIRTARMNINTNDADESVYDFVIQGTATSIPTPKISILGNGEVIVNGDNTPSLFDFTDYDSTVKGYPVSHMFSISNTGNSTLTISGVTFNGTDAAEFTLLNPPTFPLTVLAGNKTDLNIQFKATAEGDKSAQVHIANNDATQADFSFALKGFVKRNTALVETSNTIDVTLYPNPASAYAILEMNMPQADLVNVSITDIRGMKVTDVIQTNLNAGLQHINLNTSDLNTGIYFIQVLTSNGKGTIKLVVNH